MNLERGAPAVLDEHRLTAVHRTGLLDTGPDEAFDRLARLARDLLKTPYAFVTIVDERRSFWKSCIGVDATDPADRQNLVEESFCQYVINADEALVVGDARLNPLTSTNPSIEKMGVLAWAGYPLRSTAGDVLGTFCVVDTVTRDWTVEDVEVIASLAGAVEGEIRLRIMLDDAAAAADQAQDAADLRDRLARLAERLAEAETTRAVAQAITDLGPGALGASMATLGIVDDERRLLLLHGPLTDRSDLAATYTAIAIDEQRPIAAAVRLGHPIYLPTTEAMFEQYPLAAADAVTLGIVAGAALPLHQPDGKVLGAMSIGWASETAFDAEARARLRTVSWMCAQSLRRARLGDARRELMEQLQHELLPAIPAIDGLDVAVRYLPATTGLGFGGDWYDIVELDDGRVTVVVGDIPGHGIEAAARMSQVRAAISALARLYTDDLAMVCSEAERILHHLDDAYLATVVLLTIDATVGTVTYLAAGHPAPLLALPDGTVVTLEGGRRPLLGCGRVRCEPASQQLPDGAVLIAFTDGLVERRDQAIDDGIARVVETIRAVDDRAPDALADRIIGELVGDRTVSDDVALVAIRRHTIPARTRPGAA